MAKSKATSVKPAPKKTTVTSVSTEAPAPTVIDPNKPKRLPVKIQLAKPNINPLVAKRVTAVVVSGLAIAAVSWFAFFAIPSLYDQTDTAKAEKVAKENKTRDAEEFKLIEGKDRVVTMKTNFGDLDITMKNDAAPKTVESFLRLSVRKKYNNTVFHRIVEDNNFKVIQGGDWESGNGYGGKSAFDTTLPDELWKVAPQIKTDGTGFSNTPEFRDPSLYADLKFDPQTGPTVTYRKGLIIMAKTSQPNSAGSQFFITLDATVLPADYTVFGVVSDSSFSTLDKISSEVDPLGADGNKSTDGKPNKEIKINEIVLKPKN